VLQRALSGYLLLVTSLSFVLAKAKSRIFFEKALVSLFENIHFREKDFCAILTLRHINSSVKITHTSPKSWSSPLTKLAVEHNNGVGLHKMAKFIKIMEQLFLTSLLVIDIDGTLNVTSLEFIVKSSVNDNDWMGTKHKLLS